jgi:hypothetical protein
MRTPLIAAVLLAALSGCTSQSSKPVEVLDERTGVTIGALKQPIEFVPAAQNAMLMSQKRATFAYLGPVEWNRSGTLSYGLWIHIAPGNGRPPGDIRAAGAVTLVLDDGPLPLTLIEPPRAGRDAYREAVSWGQTAYFDLDVATLRRMAASRTIELDVRAADGTELGFSAATDTRSTLKGYLQSRGVTDD